MKAIHKYNKNNKEGARRIAQSYGFKHTIHMHPKMYVLLKRAGIELFPHDKPEIGNDETLVL
jgi:hypothetical protein